MICSVTDMGYFFGQEETREEMKQKAQEEYITMLLEEKPVIPRNSSKEINEISANLQELVLKYMREPNPPMPRNPFDPDAPFGINSGITEDYKKGFFRKILEKRLMQK